jgi:hypothetical protein
LIATKSTKSREKPSRFYLLHVAIDLDVIAAWYVNSARYVQPAFGHHSV